MYVISVFCCYIGVEVFAISRLQARYQTYCTFHKKYILYLPQGVVLLMHNCRTANVLMGK